MAWLLLCPSPMSTPKPDNIHERREQPGADGIEEGLDTSHRTNQPSEGPPSAPNEHRTGRKPPQPQGKPGVRQNEHR